MPITLNGDSGITTPSYGGTDTSEYLVPVTAFKNRIINGAMNVWQRGTSFTPTASTVTYTADRFLIYQTNTSPTVSRSADVPTAQGFKYSIKTQRPAANAGTAGQYIGHVIESNNMLDLAGKTVTLSFWAKAGANYSATSNNLTVQVNTGTVEDQGASGVFAASWTGVTTILSSNVTLTTSWQQFTVSGTVGSSALEMVALFVQAPTGTAGADDSFYITGVQLEKGSTATSFDYRPYGTELSLCQRYLPAFNSSSILSTIGGGYCSATNSVNMVIPFLIQTRVAPTGITVSSASHINWASTANVAATVISFNQASTTEGIVFLAVTSTSGQGGVGYFNNTSGQILFTGCEL